MVLLNAAAAFMAAGLDNGFQGGRPSGRGVHRFRNGQKQTGAIDRLSRECLPYLRKGLILGVRRWILGWPKSLVQEQTSGRNRPWKKPLARYGRRGGSARLYRSGISRAALSRPGETALIAEIKFASPSAGMIREREDPRDHRPVGTRRPGRGRFPWLRTDDSSEETWGTFLPLKKTVPIPVLRKDFILDEIQVEESFSTRRRRPAAHRPLSIRENNAAAARSLPEKGNGRLNRSPLQTGIV